MEGLAQWLLSIEENPSVVIGHDCRFAGELFAATTAKILTQYNIKVYIAKGFVSTPMVSFGVKHFNASQGVVITASHNPPSYNGFKLKGPHGGPTSPKDIAIVESMIPDTAIVPDVSLESLIENGQVVNVDLEQIYIDYLNTKFDFNKLQNAPSKLAYDAMYGAGQNVIRRVLPNAVLLNCEYNPSFNGTPPEPLHKNLLKLSQTIADTPELKIGLATDGDADRFVENQWIYLIMMMKMEIL